MEHELIDYYDENGRLLGVIDKAIAHREGLWHKSVHLWIFNSKNQAIGMFQLLGILVQVKILLIHLLEKPKKKLGLILMKTKLNLLLR